MSAASAWNAVWIWEKVSLSPRFRVTAAWHHSPFGSATKVSLSRRFRLTALGGVEQASRAGFTKRENPRTNIFVRSSAFWTQCSPGAIYRQKSLTACDVPGYDVRALSRRYNSGRAASDLRSHGLHVQERKRDVDHCWWRRPRHEIGAEPERPKAAQIFATRTAISSSVSQHASPSSDLVIFECSSTPSKSTSKRSSSKPTMTGGAGSATTRTGCSVRTFVSRKTSRVAKLS